jgi:hypothetical protein
VCKCVVWRTGSDLVAEAPFHIKLMNQMKEWLKKDIGAPFKRLLIFQIYVGNNNLGIAPFAISMNVILNTR